ncbi:hypothetical protein [Bacillus sp. Marseille-P3661]|uniref:hypothetical protein n=1 Tax=Bacillus sp. Marseille-P3661 TaxID=1936234 RepID=UPI000C85762A|nr:hypothetical protein [Bacillus sp. Marseille-P3661]
MNICNSRIFAIVFYILGFFQFQSHVNGQNTSSYKTYYNSNNGYELSYPEHMSVDESLKAIRSLLYDKDTHIEIYYDNFYNTVHDANKYINYSNQFIKNHQDHTMTYKNNELISGKKVHVLKWHRKKLKNVNNDKNYYVSAEIVKNKHEVFTILIKSSKPIVNDIKIINSFKITKPNEITTAPTSYIKKVDKKFNQETAAIMKNIFQGPVH